MTLEWYLMVGRTIAAIYREELGRSPSAGDEEGIVNWLYHAREHNRDADWIRDRIRESDEYQNPPPPPPDPEPEPIPEPPPPPPPPPPLPTVVDPRVADQHQLRQAIIRIGEESTHWPEASIGNGVAAHRVTRDICKLLADIDGRWGLITKQPGQQQCTWDWCGPGDGTGYGEDIIAFLPDAGNLDVWIGYDVIGGAGAPGATVQFVGPVDIRPGNQWAPLPPLPE